MIDVCCLRKGQRRDGQIGKYLDGGKGFGGLCVVC